jgi:hypothetical protein
MASSLAAWFVPWKRSRMGVSLWCCRYAPLFAGLPDCAPAGVLDHAILTTGYTFPTHHGVLTRQRSASQPDVHWYRVLAVCVSSFVVTYWSSPLIIVLLRCAPAHQLCLQCIHILLFHFCTFVSFLTCCPLQSFEKLSPPICPIRAHSSSPAGPPDCCGAACILSLSQFVICIAVVGLLACSVQQCTVHSHDLTIGWVAAAPQVG